LAHSKRFQGGTNGNMNKHIRAASRAGIVIAAVVVPSVFSVTAMAQTVTPTKYGFTNGQTIASAGAIPANTAFPFTIRVTANGTLDPGGFVWLSYTTNAHGDSTTVLASECGGQTTLSNHPIECFADSTGHVTLTYHTPAALPAQDHADWLAGSNSSGNPPIKSEGHYVYTTVFRFSPSPIAPSGSLSAGGSIPVTLTGDDGLDTGVPNLPMYLSFLQAPGGGSASVGATALTSTPTLFAANSGGAITVTYTAPGTLPTSGTDQIMVQDLPSSPTEFNTDSYDFTAGVPVISIGNSDITQAHQTPSVPGIMTVTISPPQKHEVTLQYVTICGIGDKWCSEDFTQVITPKTLRIAGGATSTTVKVGQFSYGGSNGGEDFNEGWFVKIENPSVGVIGRAVGEGVLLPDVENDSLPPNIWVGDAGVVPTTDTAGVPIYFVVTVGRQESAPFTFSYATSDGSATAGVDYTAVSGTATMPADTTYMDIPVTILPEAVPASNRTFTLTISNDSLGLTILRTTGTGTILSS
jgi:hypothetical protein